MSDTEPPTLGPDELPQEAELITPNPVPGNLVQRPEKHEVHSSRGTLAVLLVFAVITCGWVIRGIVSKQSPTVVEMAFAAVGLCALAVKPVESADVSISVVKVALEKFSDKATNAVVEKL